MISKQLLRRRLSIAIGKDVQYSDFTWFFGRFLVQAPKIARKLKTKIRPVNEIKSAKTLNPAEINVFSEYCGYNLNFPIPLPLW